MATQDNPQVRHWSDTITLGRSYFEHLNFEPAYDWTTLDICLENHSNTSAPLSITVAVDGVKVTDDYRFKVDKHGTVNLPPYDIGGRKSILITGYLSGGASERSLSITAKAGWKEQTPPLKKESISVSFSTIGKCLLHDLWLPGNHKWDRCQVCVAGEKNTALSGRFILIQDGALIGNENTFFINGTNSQVYNYDNLNAKAPLLVAGSLTNVSTGACVTLTGFYQEGL